METLKILHYYFRLGDRLRSEKFEMQVKTMVKQHHWAILSPYFLGKFLILLFLYDQSYDRNLERIMLNQEMNTSFHFNKLIISTSDATFLFPH